MVQKRKSVKKKTVKPAAKPAAKKQAPKKSATKEPAVKKQVVKKSTAKKSATKRKVKPKRAKNSVTPAVDVSGQSTGPIGKIPEENNIGGQGEQTIAVGQAGQNSVEQIDPSIYEQIDSNIVDQAEPSIIDQMDPGPAEQTEPPFVDYVEPGPTKQAARTPKKAKRKRMSKKRKRNLWLGAACAVIVLCLVGSCAIISWERWFRFDDAQDIQDSWVDAKTNVAVTIDAENINLPENVSYAYTLDTGGKSITFSFAQLQGEAMYLFSADRNVLYIVEGEKRNIITDVLQMLNIEELPDYFGNEQATILVRESSSATAL